MLGLHSILGRHAARPVSPSIPLPCPCRFASVLCSLLHFTFLKEVCVCVTAAPRLCVHCAHMPRTRCTLLLTPLQTRPRTDSSKPGRLWSEPDDCGLVYLQNDPSLLCSDWLLQLVSVGYGRDHQSEFLLIVSREVRGEETGLPIRGGSSGGEVCPSILSLPPLGYITACRPHPFAAIPLGLCWDLFLIEADVHDLWWLPWFLFPPFLRPSKEPDRCHSHILCRVHFPSQMSVVPFVFPFTTPWVSEAAFSSGYFKRVRCWSQHRGRWKILFSDDEKYVFLAH